MQELAEYTIQTYKNHFESGLATADPNFSLAEWDCLIPQQNITIKLLRTSQANPKLSAYSYIMGKFNFLATPMAPPGTKVVAYIDPKARETWDLNGDAGWYVGLALQHYRNIKIYFLYTRSTCICDTVTFFPHSVKSQQCLYNIT